LLYVKPDTHTHTHTAAYHYTHSLFLPLFSFSISNLNENYCCCSQREEKKEGGREDKHTLSPKDVSAAAAAPCQRLLLPSSPSPSLSPSPLLLILFALFPVVLCCFPVVFLHTRKLSPFRFLFLFFQSFLSISFNFFFCVSRLISTHKT